MGWQADIVGPCSCCHPPFVWATIGKLSPRKQRKGTGCNCGMVRMNIADIIEDLAFGGILLGMHTVAMLPMKNGVIMMSCIYS